MEAKRARVEKMLNDESMPDELPQVELGQGVSAEDAQDFLSTR